ncbi:MAG: rhomboid family intramembrane serine protease [Flavobacteriales bacterium]|jgi:membrane associated rhomboid family serine protease
MKRLLSFWKQSDALMRLLWLNGAVFIIVQLYLLVFYVQGSPAPFGTDMGLAASDNPGILLSRPWSVLTHMFAHAEFGHFLFNMISLYLCGDLFRRMIGVRPLVAVYLLAGFSGFALYFLMYNLFPALGGGHDSLILGASAAVMGIVIAVVTYRPSMAVKLFGVFDIQLVWLGVVLVLLDLVSIRKGDNTGGHIGHLGGAIFGYFYASRILKGKDLSAWLTRILQSLSRIFKKKESWEVKRSNPRMKTDDEFNTERRNRQKRVDEILDKIGRSGYDSLTKEEKDFLFKYAQK